MNKRLGVLAGAAAIGVGAVLARRKHRTAASLRGEVVLITGGSRGLGLALAREFGGEGCRIAICARDRREIDRAVADLGRRGTEAAGFECDVTSESQVARLIAAVTKHFGRIDVLVNSAGVIQVVPIEAVEIADLRQAMDVDFWGTVYPVMAILPAMLERGNGRIVNISSIGGKVGIPHLLPYASAKFAVAGFSQALAAEVRPKGVNVTAIFPGTLRTGSFSQALFKGNQRKEAEWFTLGSTVPGLSMDTDRAARQIVRAVKRGDLERTLSAPAKALDALNSLFPGGLTQILGVVSAAVLPKGEHGRATTPGKNLWPKLHPAIQALSSLGIQAMRKYNQTV